VNLNGRRVVLGVSGGIAAYKSCILARRLTESGAAVDVVLTAAATEFVRPLTFEALTKRPVLSSLWERGRALSHVELAQDADLIVLAPATAHLLARAAQGIADDLLSAILLASPSPVLVAPGMNDGRMVEPEAILVHAERMLGAPHSALRDKHVLVTAGPTREHVDPVRVITNPSSGRMGYRMAEAAFARGARVTLVSGPTGLTEPVGPEFVRVTSTEELRAAVEQTLPHADVLLMAAAPSDFRPAEPSTTKRPRAEGDLTLSLEATADVLASTIAARRPGSVMVGFALEVGEGASRAREKLEQKQLDLVVLNRVDEPESGFEVDTNRITLITRDAQQEADLMTKREAAEMILDHVEELL
jgi:phosphopantothenoylcysteine decarboxylase/phosphopantothenate--cysteine ligase